MDWKHSGILAVLFVGITCFGQGLPELSPIEVMEWRVADASPAGTYPSPVSALRFEPEVDLQARNLGEAQADLAIRGGIFENAGFRIAGASLLDPQTGHYAAELPMDPRMLSLPAVLTGAENALAGLNTSVGSVDYGWSEVFSGAEIEAGLGTDGLRKSRLYTGWAGSGGEGWRFDASAASSEGDGSIPDGGHEFHRYAGRVQYVKEGHQTDLFAGYQSKAFEWPYLYALEELHALVGSRGVESENLQTQLWMLSHRYKSESHEWGLTLHYRKNRDDYEFDVDRPGLFNPYEHETEAAGISGEGRFRLGPGWRLDAALQFQADSIESTALTFGPFRSRSLGHIAVVPARIWQDDTGAEWELRGGVLHDWSNRDDDAWSGLVEIRRQGAVGANSRSEFWLGFSEASQVPGYTAIASNPDGGLFRGNPDLNREFSRNFEAGAVLQTEGWRWEALTYFREDEDLVDWVYDSSVEPFASRVAENVDIDTLGIELMSAVSGEGWEAQLRYAYLEKDEDYGSGGADGSFYALNYPVHRVTLGLIWRPIEGVTLLVDQEWREQKENSLRDGRESGLFGQVALSWKPHREWPLEVTGRVANLWDLAFEEVPGVPGGRRTASILVQYSFW